MSQPGEGDEIKIVFTGPMGAGKTTAITAISDNPPVSTDVENIDRASADKQTTTVALDFGQLTLDDGQVVRLYGTPGQARFEFMWRILGEGALGVVVLLDATRATVLAELDDYLDAFEELARQRLLVIGLGRTESAGAMAASQLAHRLKLRKINLPLLSVDVRQRDDVLLLIEVLLSLIEAADPQETSQ